MMQCLNWWGIPTLFCCPYNFDSEGCDIALVGVPHSTGNGTTERDQHLGPRAVRNVSALGRRAHLKFELDPWNICDIRDLGDVPLPDGFAAFASEFARHLESDAELGAPT